GDGLLLRSHSASRRFYFVAPDTDCRLWMLAAAPGDRIRFQFRFFLVYSLTPAAPNASSPAPEDPCAPGAKHSVVLRVLIVPPLSTPGSCCAYFRCQNSGCIPPSLVCDPWGMDNCGDGSDQASWPAANCR
ncbi:hypothetical protein E2I00_008443, partial [Balaenoptera physalus]